MNAVFLDTVGLVALWDVDDQWHSAATTAYSKLRAQRLSVFTTTFVMLECGNTAARTTFRSSVDHLQRQLAKNRELVTPTEDDWRQGWERYSSHFAAGAGIVDQVSFVVRSRLGITDALTNDRHFKAAGFNTLF